MFLSPSKHSRYLNKGSRLKVPASEHPGASREDTAKQGVTSTWLKDLGREIFVWGLIYAGTFGLFLLIDFLNS